MTDTIKVALTHGETTKLSGFRHGLFFIHKNITVLELDFDEWPCWSVTHIKSGMRFPWSFMTEESAVAFSEDVLPVMPWAEIQATIPVDNSHIATWGMNEPTKEQKDIVKALAAKRGGFRASVKTVNREEKP